MIKLNISDIRKSIKVLNPNIDIDSPYTFYYDETNNIKKFCLKNEEDFNNSFNSNFVLGGVLFEGNKPQLPNIFDG